MRMKKMMPALRDVTTVLSMYYLCYLQSRSSILFMSSFSEVLTVECYCTAGMGPGQP